MSIPVIIYAISKIIGTGISILLVIQSIHFNNPLFQSLCNFGGKSDCNEILKSDASKITKWLSWSDVGLFYFGGTLLTLLVFPASVSFLSIATFCACPYVIYSLYIQYKLRSWCTLCIAVQVVLLTELVSVLVGSFLEIGEIGQTNFLYFCLSVIAPLIIWLFMKPYVVDSNTLKSVSKQLSIYKYNTDLFEKSLMSQPRYAVPDQLMAVELGNPHAKNVITMVSGPFCPPCARTHKVLVDLLAEDSNLKAKVIFSCQNHEDDPKTRIANHINRLVSAGDPTLASLAVNEWYTSNSKDIDAWISKFPVKNDESIKLVTQLQKEWCMMINLEHTPTLLINGYKLNAPYKVDDLKYLLT